MRNGTQSSPHAAAVVTAIDAAREDLVALCLTLGNLRDYSGEEREVAEAAAAWLAEAGIEAWLQEISETSANMVGVLRGTGDRASGGRSLILNAHIDTQGGEPVGDAETRRRLRGAWRDGDRLYGRSLANDKAQFACQMIATRAIRTAGLRLKEDLFVAGAAQETGAPPKDYPHMAAWSGVGPAASHVREGHGARWLVEHGVVADYALVSEVSDFTVTVAQSGYLRLRVDVPGNLPYTPGLKRGDAPADASNPYERATHVVRALEAWARAHERDGAVDFWGGSLVPRAQVLEIRPGGPPWTETRDHCHVFFDVRLPPGTNPAEIRHAVRAAAASAGVETVVTAYDYKRGFMSENADPLLDALREAHGAVLDAELPYAASLDMSMWRDANAFNEAGIPAIGYGPPVRAGVGPETTVRGVAGAPRPLAVDDLVATAKVFALTALTVCGVAEDEAQA